LNLLRGMLSTFFTVEYMRSITANFQELVLDNKGTTHKDNAKGVSNLIRYIGKK
jgi:hypothetical protein